MIYPILIIAALFMLFLLAALFDGRSFRDTFKTYALAYGYIYAIAWAIPAVFRAVKKEFTK